MDSSKTAMKSDKLRNMPIPKLLFSMSLPAMLSMFVHALYNIIDSVFVSHYSEKGLDALAIAFPLQMLIIAFAAGIGVGTNALAAKKLGEKDIVNANKAAQTGLFLTFIFAAVFIVVGIFATKPFISSFTNDAETIIMGTQYLQTVLLLSTFVFVEILLSKVFQATGNMKIPMIAQLIGAITNIALDPLLIFGIWIFPELGIRGAAIATVTGQGVAMIFSICMFLFTKQDITPFFKKGFRPRKEIISGIMKVGLPTIILNGLTSLTLTVVNLILKSFEYAITVLGIYIRLQSFVFMPIFGLNQGALPIMSYNYGANNKQRFNSVLRLSIITAVIIMIVGTLIFQIFPRQLLLLFNAKGGLMTAGIAALRLISISFVFAAFSIMLTIMFQSLGKGFTALVMSLMRQILLLAPLAALLAYTMGLNGIWLSYSLAEALSVIIFFPIAVATIKKRFHNKDTGSINYEKS